MTTLEEQQPPPEARVLADGPSDGVTALRYLPKQSSHLASTSWDGSVRLHQIGDNNNNENNNKALLSQSMGSGPLLSLATPQGMDAVVTGGLDGSGESVSQSVSQSSMNYDTKVDGFLSFSLLTVFPSPLFVYLSFDLHL